MKASYLWLPMAFALFQAFWCLHFKDSPVTYVTYSTVWAWLAIVAGWTLQIAKDQAKRVKDLEHRLEILGAGSGAASRAEPRGLPLP